MVHAVAVVATVYLLGSPFAVLTAIGARRRGNRLAAAMVAGLGYPVTWTLCTCATYVRRPRRRDALSELRARGGLQSL